MARSISALGLCCVLILGMSTSARAESVWQRIRNRTTAAVQSVQRGGQQLAATVRSGAAVVHRTTHNVVTTVQQTTTRVVSGAAEVIPQLPALVRETLVVAQDEVREVVALAARVVCNLDGRVEQSLCPSSAGKLVIAALGDSISVAANATVPSLRAINLHPETRNFNLSPLVHKQLSWVTGTSRAVDSHFIRLRRLYGNSVYAVNVARETRGAADLARQTQLLLRDHFPAYVTLLMGANDVCEVSQDPERELSVFRQRIVATVETLIRRNERVKILLLPIPNLERLYELGKENGCEARWNVWRMCQPLLQSNSSAERSLFYTRWRAMNEALEEIARAYDRNVKFAARIMNNRFDWSEVSPVDCFHPSITGQAKLAQIAWEESWY